MKLKIIPIGRYEPHHHERAKALAARFGYVVDYEEVEMGDPSIAEKCADANLLIVTPRLSVDILPNLKNCRLIALESTGYDCINIPRAKEMGITICNVPDYCSDEVAERVFAFILTLAHRLKEGDQTVRSGTWTGSISQIATGLHGKKIGIFGLGKIGQNIAKLAHAFGMEILGYTAHPDPDRTRKFNLRWVGFDELLTESDFMVLASPSTRENRHIFSHEAFQKMKPTATFINTARGALVDENALSDALAKGRIAGAALDVFEREPIDPDHPLLNAPNTLFTPHTAFAGDRSLDRLHSLVLDNVESFLMGNPQNGVNA